MVRPRSSIPPVPNGPRTTMAPFQAVPAPEAQPDRYSPEQLAAGRSRGEEAQAHGARPPVAPERRSSAQRPPARDDERFVPWTSGPSGQIGQAGPPAPSANYGDWTRPSRDRGEGARPAASAVQEPEPTPARTPRGRVPAPATSAIPERNAGRRGAPEVDSDEFEVQAAGRSSAKDAGGGGRGRAAQAVGGRAALRAQRQAAEADRLKAARERLGDESLGAPGGGRGRRVAVALVAVAVVALGVLGVYSFTSPHTKTVARTSAAATSAAPASNAAPATDSLPPLVTGAPSVVAAPASPVKAPVTVLNATTITGLAAKIAGTIGAGGWQTTGPGAYTGKDVTATTVYFTQGDEAQRQAAAQLVSQFPQITGPAPRFFDVPNNPTPGLVVVATGDWKP